MKEKDFVSYEQALALKELGFDEPCFAHYCNGDLITKTAILKSSTMLYYQQNNINPNNQYKHQNCTAPLYQQAFRWFREKHNLASHIATYWQHDWNNYSYQYYFIFSKIVWNGIEHYKTYEEAELDCLKKLIEIVKK
jgi:hypothetical protein